MQSAGQRVQLYPSEFLYQASQVPSPPNVLASKLIIGNLNAFVLKCEAKIENVTNKRKYGRKLPSLFLDSNPHIPPSPSV